MNYLYYIYIHVYIYFLHVIYGRTIFIKTIHRLHFRITIIGMIFNLIFQLHVCKAPERNLD